MSITYTPINDYAAKDALPANDPAKVVRGTEFSEDFVAISDAFALAAPAASPTFSGTASFTNIAVTGTVDGRDVSVDGAKLDGIEVGADVTDTANVTAAGALMDSELTNIAAVKALNQGVATTDSPTFAGATLTTTDINGGTIDGTVIGGTTAAAGSFTTGQFGTSLNVDGTVTADGLTVTGSLLSAQSTAGSNAFSAGVLAGETNQGSNAVALGSQSGQDTQGVNTTAVGRLSGSSAQGNYAVALGAQAGQTSQGPFSIAMGYVAGGTSQGANGIIISSNGVPVNDTSTGHIHVTSSQGELKFTSTGGWEMIDGGVTNLKVDASGNLLVGTATPGGAGFTATPAGAITAAGTITSPGTYSQVVSASIRDVQINSGGLMGYTTSTRETKEQIENITDVSWIYALNPVSFVYKKDPNKETQYGLIYDEVEPINPALCFEDVVNGERVPAGVHYRQLIVPLVKAMQEQQEIIEELRARVATLEGN